MLNNVHNQTKIFRFNSSLTTSRSYITEKVLQPVETLQGKSRYLKVVEWFSKFFKYDQPSIDQRALFDFVAVQVSQVNATQRA